MLSDKRKAAKLLLAKIIDEKRKTMTKICVLGATGLTGKAIVNEALANGVEVLALVRDPAKIDQQHEHLEVVQIEDREGERAIVSEGALHLLRGEIKKSEAILDAR